MVLFMGFHTIGGSYFQAVGRAKVTTVINMLRAVLALCFRYSIFYQNISDSKEYGWAAPVY